MLGLSKEAKDELKLSAELDDLTVARKSGGSVVRSRPASPNQRGQTPRRSDTASRGLSSPTSPGRRGQTPQPAADGRETTCSVQEVYAALGVEVHAAAAVVQRSVRRRQANAGQAANAVAGGRSPPRSPPNAQAADAAHRSSSPTSPNSPRSPKSPATPASRGERTKVDSQRTAHRASHRRSRVERHASPAPLQPHSRSGKELRSGREGRAHSTARTQEVVTSTSGSRLIQAPLTSRVQRQIRDRQLYVQPNRVASHHRRD